MPVASIIQTDPARSSNELCYSAIRPRILFNSQYDSTRHLENNRRMHSDMSWPNSNTSALDDDYIATKVLLTVLKSVGLAPFAIRRRSARSNQRKKHAWENAPSMVFSTSRYGCAYNLCLIALQVYVLVLKVPIIFGEDYPSRRLTDFTIDLLACAIGQASVSVIWLIFGCRQRVIARLLNRLSSFDGTTLGLNESHLPESGRTFFIVICAINIFVQAGIMYIEYLLFDILLVNYMFYIVPCVISMWACAQYTFAIKLIENRFKAVNRMLLDCCVTPVSAFHDRIFGARKIVGDGNTAQNIVTLRRAHMNLSQIASEISAFYSVPVLAAIACCYYLLITAAYLLFVPYVTRESHPTACGVVNLLLWIFYLSSGIALLATCITNVVNESNETCDVVNSLRINSNNSHDINVELDDFLYQLLHRKVRFTACGLFPLDLTLLHSIIGGVIAFLVILLQSQM